MAVPSIRAFHERINPHLPAMQQDAGAGIGAEAAAATNLAFLERLDRLKTEFLQSISHEFKTGLLGIEGFSELMLDGRESDANEVQSFARDIYNNAAHLEMMINENTQP